MKITHSELVTIGARWLFNTRGFPVVITEFGSEAEIPDILGWKGWGSTEIEVKVSYSDFRADRHKFSRRFADNGRSEQRYYLVPEKLVVKIESLLPAGWGLLYLHHNGRIIKVQKECGIFETDHRKDIGTLLSIIRRIAGSKTPLSGVNVKCYVDDSFFQHERLALEYERRGIPIDEEEIRKELEPRASLSIAFSRSEAQKSKP